jgi:outer membrane immunogenic protein
MRYFCIGLLASFAIAVFSASSGSASDLNEAPAPDRYSWTGCYLGAHVGYGWGDPTNTDNPGSDWFAGAPIKVDTDGVIGGGQLGCDYQATSNLVIGIEGSGSGADLNGSAIVNAPLASVNAKVDTDRLATLTGRVGVSFDRSLIYAKGGAAWAEDKYSGVWTVLGFTGAVSAKETRTGWTVGGGWEYALWKSLSAKIEYNYLDFGTDRVSFPAGAFGTYVGDIDETIHVVKVGLNYRFGANW